MFKCHRLPALFLHDYHHQFTVTLSSARRSVYVGYGVHDGGDSVRMKLTAANRAEMTPEDRPSRGPESGVTFSVMSRSVLELSCYNMAV